LNGVTSHNSVSSYWGITGTEDLGGGLKANFKFEQDLFPATGATGNSGADSGVATQADRAATGAFNRISLVGLSGGFGTLNFGTDYVPTFKLAAATDVFGQSYLTTVGLSAGTHGVGLGTITGGAIGNISTATNSLAIGSGSTRQLQYSTPNFGGFTGNLAFVNSDNSYTGGTVAIAKNKQTNVSGIYSNGPLYVGLAFGSREAEGTATLKAELTVFGASYDFQSFKLVGNYLSAKSSASNVAGDTKSTEYNLGVTVPFGAVTAIAQIGRNTYNSDVTGQDGDASGNDWALGADYALSKRTTAFVKTGTSNKLEGTIAAQTRDTKRDVTTIGVRHTF